MRSTGRRPADEDGFTLLGALLLLAVLSLTAAAGLLLASAASSVSAAHAAAAEAGLAADAGLSELLAGAVGPPPPQIVVPVPGGPAVVSSERLVATADGRPLYRIRSMAPATGGEGPALREVERLALPIPPMGTLPAALVALGPVTAGGAGALVSGRDGSPPEACPTPPGDVAGASVPPGGAAGLTAGTIEGTPPVLESPDPAGPAVVVGSNLVARLAALAGSSPHVRVAADGAWLGAAETGSGLLVATGDLRLGDGFGWEGLVVVAGTLSLEGAPTLRGGVLAGLGGPGVAPAADPSVDLGTGAPTIVRDRCAAAVAAAAASRLRAVPGSWREAF